MASPEGMDATDLLNDWQRDFPLVARPFEVVASAMGLGEAVLLQRWRGLHASGALSRIGGVFAAHAGGAALLSAMAVPASRLDEVAAAVSAHPGVNHNYQREHAFNLWFVMTGRDTLAVEAAMQALESATGLRALRLPMRRPYRIDLGFDLRSAPAAATASCTITRDAPPVAPADTVLAACVEAGLPLEAAPFEAWAQASKRSVDEVLACLQGWLHSGTLRRFGVIVRHHELGMAANAMTVFDVPDEAVDACGAALARQPGITLAYRRARDAGWSYNLYGMVHGRDRDTVRMLIDAATARAGLAGVPREVLFSCRRFKQTGARRFRPLSDGEALELPRPCTAHATETRHAVA